MKQKAFTEIGRLLFVIFGAVFLGVILACFMLYQYGPSGTYKVQNVLFDPSGNYTIRMIEKNSKTGKLEPFVFDRIEFNYFDESKKQWLKIPVSNAQYSRLYRLVLNEKSLNDVPEKVVDQFYKKSPASLVFQAHPESGASNLKEVLRVEFANQSNYYRVQLRSEGAGAAGLWAYFYHPKIYQKAIQIFTQKS